ncbi:PAS domain-containing protein [Paenalcaligenes sp. Me131]|uniref:PAS domain-containing protein n=1 Tax=Paenalcaligenes sp. Me131 TaxID=3392636 RepID=UPI003D2B9898
MFSRQTQSPKKTVYGYTLLVMVIFLALVSYAVVQLVNQQKNVRTDMAGHMLWASTQAQQEGLRLMTQIAMVRTDNGASYDSLFNQYEIFLSRLTLLLTGPQKRNLMHSGELNSLLSVVGEFEGSVIWSDGRKLSSEELSSLENSLKPLLSQLQVSSNRVLLFERENTSRTREVQIKAVWQLVIGVLGLLISGGYLFFCQLMEVQRAQNAERMTIRAKEFSELLLGASDEGVLVLDERFVCLSCNRAAQSMLNLNPERVVGKSVLSIRLFPQLEPAVIEALNGHKAELNNIELIDASGEIRYLDFAVFPLHLKNGPDGVVVFVRDNTERYSSTLAMERQWDEKATRAWRRSQELETVQRQLVRVFDAAPVGLCVFASTGECLYSNVTSQKRLIEELGGQQQHVTVGLQGALDRLNYLLEQQGQLVPGQGPWFEEGKRADADVHMPDGTWQRVSYDMLEGGVHLFCQTDISAYKQTLWLQQQLGLHTQHLSTLSTKFAEQLGSLLSSSESIRGDNKTSTMLQTQRENVLDMQHNVQWVNHQINTALETLRFMSGEVRAIPAPYALFDMLDQVLAQSKRLAPDIWINLHTDVYSGLMIEGDERLIQKALLGLLLQYADSLGRQHAISLQVEEHAFQIGIVLRPLMANEQVEALLDLGMDKLQDTSPDVMGMGIYLARQVARMHGGDVYWGHDDEGSLCRFTFDKSFKTITI